MKLQSIIIRKELDYQDLIGKIVAIDAPNIIMGLFNFARNIQLQIALSIFEFFNKGKYINAKDITPTTDNIFYIRKDKYPDIANNRE